MQLNSVPTLTDLTRQERLDLWMRRTGTTFVLLGEICGIHANCVTSHLRADTMPVRHHAALVAAGMPLELLPDPQDQKPGPKPKQVGESSDSHERKDSASAA